MLTPKVGRQLAEVLIAREHGQRPVTLIGYSLGAKVIFHCLEHLYKKKGKKINSITLLNYR